LPGVWDHLEVLVSIAGLAFGVNADALIGAGSLAVGGAIDDEGVRAHGEAVDGGLDQAANWPNAASSCPSLSARTPPGRTGPQHTRWDYD